MINLDQDKEEMALSERQGRQVCKGRDGEKEELMAEGSLHRGLEVTNNIKVVW